MAACCVSGKTVKSSFNLNCNFFQRHCVIAQSQKRCVLFSPKELQEEQDDVVLSPKSNSISFKYRILFSILY